jgi:hypothetical protein
LKVFHINNKIGFDHHVYHLEKGETLVDDIAGLSALLSKILLVYEQSAVACGGQVVFNFVPNKARHSVALLLKACGKASVADHIKSSRFINISVEEQIARV